MIALSMLTGVFIAVIFLIIGINLGVKSKKGDFK